MTGRLRDNLGVMKRLNVYLKEFNTGTKIRTIEVGCFHPTYTSV